MKTGKKSIAIILCAAIFLAAVLTGCGSNEKKLEGYWVAVSDVPRGESVPNVLNLLSDNIGSVDGIGITWGAVDGRLTITTNIFSLSYTYKYSVSGNKMKLTTNDGTVVTYKKK